VALYDIRDQGACDCRQEYDRKNKRAADEEVPERGRACCGISWISFSHIASNGWSESRGGSDSFSSARPYGKTKIMKKSIKVKPKRGRPPTGGRNPFVGIRLPQELIVRVDAWAKLNGLSRSEAIRRFVEQALPA
jgi:hypothetical protein